MLGLLERLISAPRPDLVAVSKAEVKVVDLPGVLTSNKKDLRYHSMCVQESLWVLSNLLGGSAYHRDSVLCFNSGLSPVPYSSDEARIGD